MVRHREDQTARPRLSSHVTPNPHLERKRSYQISFAHGDYPEQDPRRPCLAASRTGRTCRARPRLRGDDPPSRRGRKGERVAPGTSEGVRQALEEAAAEFIPDGVRRRRTARPGTRTLYEDLRAISLPSAARLHGCELLTDADLYDENGLPV